MSPKLGGTVCVWVCVCVTVSTHYACILAHICKHNEGLCRKICVCSCTSILVSFRLMMNDFQQNEDGV